MQLEMKSGRLLKVLVVLMLFAFAMSSASKAAEQASQRPIDGSTLFRLNCSSSYCHGETGKGGGAPGLRGRTLDPSRLARVIDAGIPGTAMPAFGPRFSQAEIEELVAYVRSLGALPLDENGPGRGAEASRDVSADVEGGRARSDASSAEMVLGREVFFDVIAMDSCRVCHTFEGKGGKVGPDLTRVGLQSEDEIRKSIISPSAKVVAGFETLRILTRDGQRITGVKRDENDDRLRVYDVTEMPPISRSIRKSEILGREVVSGSVMPPPKRLSEAQLRALIALLKQR